MAAGAVHRTEVDGVPVFWADGPGNAVGQLVFRVGQADEPLPLRGMTHLIEHLALASLGLHLFHGVWSMFQTLGINNRDWDGFFRGLAVFVAIVIPLGFFTVPLAVMFGILKLPG